MNSPSFLARIIDHPQGVLAMVQTVRWINGAWIPDDDGDRVLIHALIAPKSVADSHLELCATSPRIVHRSALEVICIGHLEDTDRGPCPYGDNGE